jgi:hypothetical protein
MPAVSLRDSRKTFQYLMFSLCRLDKERGVSAWIKYGVSIYGSFTLMITTETDRNLGQEQGESLLRSTG